MSSETSEASDITDEETMMRKEAIRKQKMMTSIITIIIIHIHNDPGRATEHLIQMELIEQDLLNIKGIEVMLSKFLKNSIHSIIITNLTFSVHI